MVSDAPDPIPDAATIVGLLADDSRRRVLAALVLGATTGADIRKATGLTAREVATALTRLIQKELVIHGDDGEHLLIAEAFRRAAVAAAPARPTPDSTGDASDDTARVLRSFLRDGRLTRIPRAGSKRLVVFDRLVQDFDIGVRYPERDVNKMLRTYHDDFAALRRYMVDDGFLDRADGFYWRCGGTSSI